jgi:hypothetical protein
MLEPNAVTTIVQERFRSRYAEWARGDGAWPMRVSLGAPDTQERQRNPAACFAWAARWRNYTGPGTVETANKQFPTGTAPMPVRLTIISAHEAATVSPRHAATWQRCEDRLIALQGQFPEGDFDKHTIQRITDLDEADYHRLTATVTWLRNNDVTGMLPRQLPIEGIGTKWLETHTALVAALLGPGELEEPPVGNSKRALFRRLGLRELPTQLPVHVLDPDLRTVLGGMRHIQAPVEDLNQWPQTPEIVIISENKQTAYALDGEDLPRTVVVHAMGLHTDLYPQVRWIKEAKLVIYWGDLDTHGLEFLDKLRGFGINARSILTNAATLKQFRHLTATSGEPNPRPVPNLSESEQELYAILVEHFTRHHEGLVLEQERIPWDVALAAIHDAINQ